jgi:hypothetical protein
MKKEGKYFTLRNLVIVTNLYGMNLLRVENEEKYKFMVKKNVLSRLEYGSVQVFGI